MCTCLFASTYKFKIVHPTITTLITSTYKLCLYINLIKKKYCNKHTHSITILLDLTHLLGEFHVDSIILCEVHYENREIYVNFN
jgi:hypothetical protein